MMSPAARALATTPPDCCLWGIGHPPDDSFRFCGEPATPGKPYCERHRRKSVSIEDGAAILSVASSDTIDDAVSVTPSDTAYRIVAARGRNIGSKRQWRVVPLKGGGPARRSPDSASAEPAPAAPQPEDAPHTPPPGTRSAHDRGGGQISTSFAPATG
jgi:hypothetical protein